MLTFFSFFFLFCLLLLFFAVRSSSALRNSSIFLSDSALTVFVASSWLSFAKRSLSRRVRSLYMWNSPLPAPAIEDWPVRTWKSTIRGRKKTKIQTKQNSSEKSTTTQQTTNLDVLKVLWRPDRNTHLLRSSLIWLRGLCHRNPTEQKVINKLRLASRAERTLAQFISTDCVVLASCQ